jgi:hypothetical protein
MDNKMTEFNIPPGTTTQPKPLSETGNPEEPAEDTRIKYKDEDQLNDFWNCILRKQPYKKEFNIKGLKIVLRTKTTKEVEELMLHMDQYNTSLVQTYDYLYSKSLLALSLVQIGEEFIDSGSFEQKLNFVDTLPDVTIRMIIKAAGVFEKEIEDMEAEIYNPNF